MKTLPKNWKPDNNTNWIGISSDYELSEDFIRKYKDKVNWYNISTRQKLNEDFIREFKDYVSWYWISYYQELSEDFIREYKDKVDWDCIFICQKHISHKFLNQYQYKIKYSWIDMIGREYF